MLLEIIMYLLIPLGSWFAIYKDEEDEKKHTDAGCKHYSTPTYCSKEYLDLTVDDVKNGNFCKIRYPKGTIFHIGSYNPGREHWYKVFYGPDKVEDVEYDGY